MKNLNSWQNLEISWWSSFLAEIHIYGNENHQTNIYIYIYLYLERDNLLGGIPHERYVDICRLYPWLWRNKQGWFTSNCGELTCTYDSWAQVLNYQPSHEPQQLPEVFFYYSGNIVNFTLAPVIVNPRREWFHANICKHRMVGIVSSIRWRSRSSIQNPRSSGQGFK